MTLDPHPNARAIRSVLHSLLKASPHIRAAAVVRLSGLTIASVMPYSVEQERVSAMSAVILMLGERLAGAMSNGELNQVYIEGQNGHIVLMLISGDAVLHVAASEEVPLGLVFLEMKQAVERLTPLL